MNLRQAAGLLDVILLLGLIQLVMTTLGIAPLDFEPWPGWPGFGLQIVLFAVKDGWRGRSPGKWLLGVQVVDRRSGAPARLLQSVVRNWFLAPPFMWVVLMLTMDRGPRLGDGWAKTRVVWRRYRDHPVFSEAAAAAQVFE